MIKLLRVDDRLLHGQVAYSWKAFLDYNAIIILNDKVALDDFRKSAIKMCLPSGVKLAIRGLDDGIKLLKDEKLSNFNVFVIVESIKDASYLLNNIEDKLELNIGGIANKEGSKLVAKGTYLNENELLLLNELKNKGIYMYYQLVPNDEKIEI